MAASFVNAKKTFSQIVNGVTKLVASLFNVVYDEVEAVETFIGATGGGAQSYSESMTNLLYNYRVGCSVDYKGAADLYVRSGEIMITDASGNRRLRRNSSDTTVTWSDIAAGSEAASTTYYVYACADTNATTFTVKISTSASAAESTTYYKLIGTFYNDASSNIAEVANLNRNVKFNNWVAKAASTTYLALTDGWVRLTKQDAGTGQLVSDSANPPMTVIGGFYTDGSNPFAGCYPVRKNDYWRVPAASTVYWMGLS